MEGEASRHRAFNFGHSPQAPSPSQGHLRPTKTHSSYKNHQYPPAPPQRPQKGPQIAIIDHAQHRNHKESANQAPLKLTSRIDPWGACAEPSTLAQTKSPPPPSLPLLPHSPEKAKPLFTHIEVPLPQTKIFSRTPKRSLYDLNR